MARDRRRSRVLEYFEQQAETAATEESGNEENPDGGGDDPFQDFDDAFGLDLFNTDGGK